MRNDQVSWVLVFVLLMFGQASAAKDALIPTQKLMVDGQIVDSVKEAQALIVNGSTVYIGNGEYRQGLHIRHNNVIISGSKSTHFKSASILGKGTFVVSGNDVTIENIECSGVSVPSNNGACVRQEGQNLTLTNVNFHDSQQGILSGSNTGRLLIQFSHFERLGYAGKAHAIYSANSDLIIRHSTIINSVDEGHEVKSRAKRTVIEYSVIGSHNTNDSRSIDISNGGELNVKSSIIFQGPKTVNRQLIGYGLEGRNNYKNNDIQITNNILILERLAPNEILGLPKKKLKNKILRVSGNTIIGQQIVDKDKYRYNNRFVATRAELKLTEGELPNMSLFEAL